MRVGSTGTLHRRAAAPRRPAHYRRSAGEGRRRLASDRRRAPRTARARRCSTSASRPPAVPRWRPTRRTARSSDSWRRWRRYGSCWDEFSAAAEQDENAAEDRGVSVSNDCPD
ncbi:hypothetical protein G6F24_017202 [Rhizopus arrhizus]|nr:hypothetical protein G6F24_017202 [Rhizopus arrhizus]